MPNNYKIDRTAAKILINTNHFSYYAALAPESVIPIRDAKIDLNNDGIPDLLGRNVSVVGIVTAGINTFDNTRLNIYIQDENAGINVYSTSIDTELYSGYRVKVFGTISQNNGMTQITNPIITILNIDDTPPTTITVNAAQLSAQPEKYEGLLIEMLADDSGARYNYNNDKIWKAAENGANFYIYINNKTHITDSFAAIPYPKTYIKGVWWQNDNLARNYGGYFILPRNVNDFRELQISPPVANLGEIIIKNNPFCPELNQSLEIWYSAGLNERLEIKAFNIQGRLCRDVYSGIVSGAGKIVWDGKTNFGRYADIGIYVLYVMFNNRKMTKPISVAAPLR